MRAWNHKVAGIALLSALTLGCNTAPAELDADGAQLFTNYCAPCHGADGQGTAAVAAPSLAGLPAWYVDAQFRKFREGVRGAHYDDVAGLRMRPMSRTLTNDTQITAVAAHVASLTPQHPAPTLHGDPAKGATAYATCAACHGPDGMGNQALNAPPLVYANDWYLLTQLTHFKSGVRGKDPRDITGAQMAPMAATLADEQAMTDVIAYIGTLSPAAASATHSAPAAPSH